MADAPGALGIDALTREVRRLKEETVRSQQALSVTIETRLWAVEAGICRLDERLERIGSTAMATLDTLAGQVGELRGDAQTEAQEVKTKLDEMTALIEELRQNANDPAKIEEISTDLASLKGDIQGIFTGEAPPEPVPAPARRRK